MKKFKLNKIVSTAIISVLAISTVISLYNVANSVINALEYDESSYTIDTNNGHSYKCYTIAGDANSVAIAWLNQNDNPMPADVVVADHMASGKTVKVLARGAFRYGTLSTIALPTTIEDIKEEAFAYCESLTEFTFPYQIQKVERSTFIDCRNLATLFYTNSSGNRVLGNSTIKEIGDHAFDSCVKLENFYCPSSVTKFGESCFQNCDSLSKFFFPSNIGTNAITVESYAFADCDTLASVYFEENLTTVKHHAFSNSLSTLKLQYYYTNGTPSFDSNWRDIHIASNNTEVYELQSVDQIFQNDDYPGLVFSVHNEKIRLDSAFTNKTYVTDLETGILIHDDDLVDKTTDPYIVIDSFSAPFANQAGYYEIVKNGNTVTNRIITIPNYINVDGYGSLPVKVIGESAFAGDCGAWKFVFNQNLVQIRHRAFYRNDNLNELDFTTNQCTNLKELSYELFETPGRGYGKEGTGGGKDTEGGTKTPNQHYNTNIKSLVFPYSLEYIGDAAFYNFKQLHGGAENAVGITFQKDANDLSHLKLIGDWAFAVRNGENYTATYSNELVVPNSLNDYYAPKANFFHPYLPYYKFTSRINRYAIGLYAFENARWMSSFRMEPATTAQKQDATHTTSFASNAFVRNPSLIRVETNYNTYLVGKDMFKGSDNLRELFLHSERAEAGTYDMPWGLNDYNSTFGETILSGNTARPEVVIYVSGPSAPKDLDNPDATGYSESQNKNMWNSDSTNTFSNGLNGQGRSHVPTHYNINWDGDNDIFYWDPEGNAKKSKPKVRADYDAGLISIVKQSSNYVVAKYYTNAGNGNVSNEIDLTNITGFSGTITEIGEGAFANNEEKSRGYYFILPSTVTKIGERAFYRGKDKKQYAARVVTYKDGSGNIVKPTAETRTYAQVKTATASGDSYGYCCLPSSVTTIERNAFYNNLFKNVELGSGLSFLGNAAFYVHRSNAAQINNIVYTPGVGAPFTFVNNGIYSKDDGTNAKTLLYQAAAGNGANTTLTIDSDTVAVGARALAKSKYTTVTLNDGLTTIYGSGFDGSAALTEVNGEGLDTLQYITSKVLNGETEAVPNPTAFDIVDYKDACGSSRYTDAFDATNYYAFRNCTALTTMDFSQMSSLKKIGKQAFLNDAALNKLTFQGKPAEGGDPAVPATVYNFYSGTPSDQSEYEDGSTGLTTNVLDLNFDDHTNLKTIASSAFESCSNIKYVILPNTTGSNHFVESNFSYCKEGGDGYAFPRTTTTIMCGETYYQADYITGSVNRRNHYNINRDYTQDKVYYRFYAQASELAAGKSITDYVTTSALYVDNTNYWTIYNGDYYLMTGRAAVLAFYNEVNGTNFS